MCSVCSCGGGVQCDDAEDVVDSPGHEEPGSVSSFADVAQLATAGDGLDPAERFLDAFSVALTDLMAGVAGGAPVDGAAPVGGVGRDVRSDPEVADLGDERGSVIGLVAGHGSSPFAPGETFEHLERSVAFGI